MSEQKGRRTLVLFYSWSGNTRKIARLIAQKTGADWKEIVPEQAYPSNYNTVVEQAKQEIQARHYPALRPIDMDWGAYETVYLGTPNWWSTMAPPVASFLNEVMPTDKVIVPFCTHGGGGAGHIAADIAKYCIGCDVLPLLAVQEDGGSRVEGLVDQWLKKIGG